MGESGQHISVTLSIKVSAEGDIRHGRRELSKRRSYCHDEEGRNQPSEYHTDMTSYCERSHARQS